MKLNDEIQQEESTCEKVELPDFMQRCVDAEARVGELEKEIQVQKELIHELETNLKFECVQYGKTVKTLQEINADSHERITALESVVVELAKAMWKVEGEDCTYDSLYKKREAALSNPIVVELLKGREVV